MRSRFARRIFVLFVVAALLPMAVLSFVALSQVSSELSASNVQAMRRSCRAYGMSCLERLLIADESLAARAGHLADASAGEVSRLLAPGEDELNRFRGFALLRDGEAREGGTIEAVPRFRLAPDERARIGSGEPLLRLEPVQLGPPRVFLLRAVAGGEAGSRVLAGEVSPHFLWSPESIPAFNEIAVIADSGQVLFQSTGLGAATLDQLRAQIPGGPAGDYELVAEGETQRVAEWALFLRPRFGGESWTFSVVMSLEDILAPIRTFRRTFLLLALLVFWVVCLISVVWIRHGLKPLRALTEGTRRIAGRDYAARVEVASTDEFRDLAESFNDMASRLERRFRTVAHRTKIDRALLQLLDEEAILAVVAETLPRFVNATGLMIAVQDRKDPDRLRTCIRIGARAPRVRTMRVATFRRFGFPLDEPERTFDLRGRDDSALKMLRDEGVSTIRWFPLGGAVGSIGFLGLGLTEAESLSGESIEDTRQVAAQVTIALSNARLLARLEDMQWGVMTALARAIDAKSGWTSGHSERVSALALRIAERLEVSRGDREVLHVASLLHDIGKLAIAPDLLDKVGRLTDEEREIMRSHVRHGIRILEPVADLAPAVEVIAQHHERLDGSGYPRGLVGEAIHPLARILAVADMFDAMTSDRPYRSGLSADRACAEILSAADAQLDPDVVAAFLALDPPPAQGAEPRAVAPAAVDQPG